MRARAPQACATPRTPPWWSPEAAREISDDSDGVLSPLPTATTATATAEPALEVERERAFEVGEAEGDDEEQQHQRAQARRGDGAPQRIPAQGARLGALAGGTRLLQDHQRQQQVDPGQRAGDEEGQ